MERFYYSITIGADPGEPGDLTVMISDNYERVYSDTLRAREITAGFSLTFEPTVEGIQREEFSGETDWEELRLILTNLLVIDQKMSPEKAEYWISNLFEFLSGRKEFPVIDEHELEAELALLTPADFLE